MSNWLSTLRALIVGAPNASARLPLPISSAPLGSAPLPLEVKRRKYARSPLKVRGGRARARAKRADDERLRKELANADMSKFDKIFQRAKWDAGPAKRR